MSGALRAVGLGLTGLALAACLGKRLDLGQDRRTDYSDGSGGTVGSSPGAAGGLAVGGSSLIGPGEIPPDATAWLAAGACKPSPDSPFVGTWKGHWPDQVQPDIEAVLTIAGLTDSGVPCGTIKLGEGPPLMKAADPDEIYPPGASFGGGPSFGLSLQNGAAWQGYEYELVNVRSSDTRLAFAISFGEILRSWCQLQQGFADSSTCLPLSLQASQQNLCWRSPSGDPVELQTCLKASYCRPYDSYASNICVCRDEQCDALITPSARVELHWRDGSLEGSVDDSRLIFLDSVPP